MSTKRLSIEDFEKLEREYAKQRVEDGILQSVLARVPPSWRLIDKFPGGAAFVRGGLKVLMSVMRYSDMRIWVHVSVSGHTPRGRWLLPDWEDLKRVKNEFIGPDRYAYQVLPAQKDYVNDNEYVLHLFSLLDGEPALPDFRSGLRTL